MVFPFTAHLPPPRFPLYTNVPHLRCDFDSTLFTVYLPFVDSSLLVVTTLFVHLRCTFLTVRFIYDRSLTRCLFGDYADGLPLLHCAGLLSRLPVVLLQLPPHYPDRVHFVADVTILRFPTPHLSTTTFPLLYFDRYRAHATFIRLIYRFVGSYRTFALHHYTPVPGFYTTLRSSFTRTRLHHALLRVYHLIYYHVVPAAHHLYTTFYHHVDLLIHSRSRFYG